MAPKKKDKLPWPFQQLIAKLALSFITISIGLWCGFHDSYSSFYVAVLVQSINNMYDSYGLLKGYTMFITAFQTLAILSAVVSFVIAVLSFTGAPVNCLFWVCSVVALLSVPMLHLGIEIINRLMTGKF